MRKHNTAVGKLKTTGKCDICPYETKDQSNLSKHTKRVHSEKPEKVKKSRDCSDCGKTFLRKDKFDNHVRVHHKNEAPLETCKDCDHKFTKSADLVRHVNTVHDRIKKVTSKAGFGTFVRNEKVKVPKQFLCSECSKTFNSSANLKRHMSSGLHTTARKKKKGSSRTTVMRKVKKLLSDSDVLKEIQRQRKHGSSSGVIGETLVKTIMAQIPNISRKTVYLINVIL